MSSAAPIAAGVGAAAEIWQGEKEMDRMKDARRDQRASLDDAAYRREATYRGDRSALQGAIEDFYKQKGWAIPERLPGAYTTRGLPGEAPLYPGVSKENPQPITAGAEDESEAQQIASGINISSEPVEEAAVVPAVKPIVVAEGATTKLPANLQSAAVAQAPTKAAPLLSDREMLYIPDRKYAATKEILPRISLRK